MKALVIVLMLTLVGCATKSVRPTDTNWSDYIHDVMLQCGVVAGQLGAGDDKLADALYNQCLRDMNATL